MSFKKRNHKPNIDKSLDYFLENVEKYQEKEMDEANERWVIKQDGKVIKRGFDSQNAAFIELHKLTPVSWSKAIKDEGYEIVQESDKDDDEGEEMKEAKAQKSKKGQRRYSKMNISKNVYGDEYVNFYQRNGYTGNEESLSIQVIDGGVDISTRNVSASISPQDWKKIKDIIDKQI